MRTHRILGSLVIALGLLKSVAAAAPVDCSNPDNLCTGDPCVVPSLEVAHPCEADFGPRTLVIAGTLRVPLGGDLTLSAQEIVVHGGILANRSDQVDVALIATDGLAIRGSVRLLGFYPVDGPGDLLLSAGGDIDIAGPIRLFSNRGGGSAHFVANAGGTLTVSRTISANGANVNLSGTQGVNLRALIRAGGFFEGAFVTLGSTAGAVLIDGPIRIPGLRADVPVGGKLQVDAFGDIVVNKPVRGRAREIGARVSLNSTAGDVTTNASMLLTRAGELKIKADGLATLNGSVSVAGNGFFSGSNLVSVEASSITVNSAVTISGYAPMIGSLFCFEATDGDLRLGGTFLATGGKALEGTIKGSATGDVVADGEFRCAPNGCIALTAGGTLDTSAGSFDKPLSSDCPRACPD